MRLDREAIANAAALLNRARSAWALTGAGVSTPSGIPDFRSPGGLWDLADPEEVSSLAGFRRNPEAFYSFWMGRFRQMEQAQPNAVHALLARLEREGRLRGVITQNVDGLHQKAGSQTVFEVHGHLRWGKCILCQAIHPMEEIIHQTEAEGVARCACGGLIKPEVVLFGEDLPPDFGRAWEATAEADLLFVAGTSLTVWPVAGLVPRASCRGATLIIANRDPTPYDDHANVLLRGDLVETARALEAASE